MDEMEAFIDRRVRESLGDGELPTPLIAMTASLMAYLDSASMALEKAVDISGKLELGQATADLKKASREVDLILVAVTDWLIAVGRVGKERAVQRKMEG